MLQATNVTKYFGGDAILEGVGLSLVSGERVALVGPNGAGKTTLLRIILGELDPDSGQVTLAPGRTVAYLPQDAGVTPGRSLYGEMLCIFSEVIGLEEEQRRLEREMAGVHPDSPELMRLVEAHAHMHGEFERRGGYTLDAEIGRVLYGLGFTMEDYHKQVEHFSGGWQMRIALARLLLQRPDLLLLDEPTNHLDLRATEWLESYLRQYRGAVMLVSHDRYFLNLVSTRTLELERGRITQYQGNYSYYTQEKARRRREQESAYRRQQDYLARQQAWIDRFHADKRRSSQTKSREKLLEKMDRVEAPLGHQKTVSFRFSQTTPSGRKVFDLRDAGKAYDGKWVFRNAELLVERGDRVALVGPNGAGKSTLLRLLAAVEKPDAGVVSVGPNVQRAYYAQDQSESLEEGNTALQEIHQAAPGDWSVEEMRTMLGRFLFTGDDVHKPVSVLSGGERSRLALAKMLLRATNVLLLDEPTNHLDAGSRETLESALAEYPGTLVLASHDRYLIDKLANKVVEVEGEQITLYLGNYTNYRQKKAQEAAEGEDEETRGRGDAGTRRTQNPELTTRNEDLSTQDSALSTPRSAPGTRRPALSPRQLQKELASVEREIMSAEERIAELGELLAGPEAFADHERTAPLLAEYTDLSERLPELNQRWEELGALLAG